MYSWFGGPIHQSGGEQAVMKSHHTHTHTHTTHTHCCRPGFGVTLNKEGLERPYTRSQKQVRNIVVPFLKPDNVQGDLWNAEF